MNSKICPKCKSDRPLSDFNKKRAICKLCRKDYSHNYDMARKTIWNYSDPFYKENTKVCTRCGIEKTLLEFTKDYKSTNGLKPHCNDCRKPYYRKVKNALYNPAVYNIINKNNGEILYVGETETPQLRIKNHLSKYSFSPISKLLLSGKINFEDLLFEIIEYVEDKQTRLEREKYWIREKNPKYNIKR